MVQENQEAAPSHVQAIREISKSINQSMNSSMGEFRRAADGNNKNILKVVKDLGASILSQRKQLAGLTESIEEVAETSNKMANKLDQLNNHLSESINVQQDILAQMKNVFGGINAMNNNWAQLSSNTNNTSIFGNIMSTLKTITTGGIVIAGGAIAANEAIKYMGGEGKATVASGNLAQNQQEAYKAAKAEGLSDKAAKILTANMSGESLAKPNAYNRDVNSRGEFVHMAQGIVQWDPQRSEEIKRQFGKYPKDMTVAEQTKAAIWEMKTKKEYTKAWTAMMDESLSDQDRMYAVVKHYEKPAFAERDTGRRLGYLRGLKVDNKTAATETKAEAKEKQKVTGEVTSTPETTPKSETAPDAAPAAPPPPATPNAGGERHPEAHGGIISGAAKQEYGGEGKVDKNALAGKDLSGVNKDLVSKLTAAASEFKAKTGQPVSVTSGMRTAEKQAQLYQAYISGKSSIPANPPGKSNHETGNAVDVSSNQARQMDKMGILAKYGLSRPLGEKDPVHIQLSGTGTSQASYGKGGGSPDATPAGGKEQAVPGADKTIAGGESGGESAAPDAEKPQPTESEKHGAGLMQLAMGGGMGGFGGIMAKLSESAKDSIRPGSALSMKMNEMAGIPTAQPIMAPERPVPVESPNVAAAANTIEQSAIQQQIEDYNYKQKAGEVSEKLEQSRDLMINTQQGEGSYIPGIDYNGSQDQEVISKWAERLGFGGSHYKELDKIKLF